MKVIDIGNQCVHCRQDTSFGSGRWVDRYPAEILDEENDIVLDGYCCNVCEPVSYTHLTLPTIA